MIYSDFEEKAMSGLPKFSIDLNEKFSALAHAPAIEAVIHWQAPASKTLDFEKLREELTQRLPDYPICDPQFGLEFSATASPDGAAEVSQRTQWDGFTLQDAQNRHVAQFTRSGVAFSRLEPYEDWQAFQSEAMRFWTIFLALAEPTEIQRLGIRYINRIALNDGEQPSLYLNTVPPAPPGIELPTEAFFHQDMYKVPNYPYHINWVRTIQPKGADLTDGQALIVDIDVSTTDLLELDKPILTQRLHEMRWLKNKFFFSCTTETALQRFGAYTS
jgi:uncharacterized protein (TIGR04255 family)